MVSGSSTQYGGISPLLGLGTVTEIIESLPPIVDTVDERVSTQLRSLLPDFITADHPTFSAFVQAYFEWMERDGNPRYATVKHLSIRDIDETVSSFITHFNSEYLHGFPASFSSVVNERAAIKRIGDLYRSKGGEKAVLLLFRLLYNETVSIIRPGERILGLSNAVWDDPITVFVSRTHGISLASDAIGRTLFQTVDGLETGAVETSAFIEDGRFFTFKNMDVAEYRLKSVLGTFIPNKPVFYTSGSTSYKETAFPMVGSIGVTGGGGTGYVIQDKIVIRDTVLNASVAEAIVANTDTKGAITSVIVTKRFPNYIEGHTLDFDFITGSTTDVTPGGTGATLEIFGTVAGFRSGRYNNSKDILGAADRIQDNNYYQRYSYSVRTSKGIEDFRDSLKEIAHPAGYKVFADTILGVSGDGFTGVTAPILAANKGYYAGAKEIFIRYGHTQAFESPMIGHYLPYTFDTFTDFRGYVTGPTSGGSPNGFFVDLFPFGYNGVTGDLSGNFVVGGRTAHVPQASTAAGGATAKLPIGVSDGTPDGITVGYGITESGHQLLDQIVWYNTASLGASATTGDSLALAVYPHPNGRCSNSFGEERYGDDGKNMWSKLENDTGFVRGLTMDFQKLEKIKQPVCRVFIDSITGDSVMVQGDLVVQQVPGQPEAIGRLEFEFSNVSTVALQSQQKGASFVTGFTTGTARTPSKEPTSGLGFIGSYDNAFIDIKMISGRFSSVTGAGETAPYPIVSVTGGATLTVIAKPYSVSGPHINMLEGVSLDDKPEFRFLPIFDFLNNMPFADTSTNKANYTSE